MIARWMDQAASRAEATFRKHGIQLTLGGEPTYVPVSPQGPEWNYAAVGPTKLGYAWKVAENLVRGRMAGAVSFFCPGKLYPGEVNPRWVIRILANRDGTALFPRQKNSQAPGPEAMANLASGICRRLRVAAYWMRFVDRGAPSHEILAMPIDHDETGWRSSRWGLARDMRHLSGAEGPAGLRLPLDRLPAPVAHRAICIEQTPNSVAVFVPPLLQKPFLELLSAIEQSAANSGIGQLTLQGYTPVDEMGKWITVGLAADPGVLEVNLPPCSSWHEYAEWIEAVTSCCEAAGLRSWKESAWDFPQGTGGGNHLLWGGPKLEANPFFGRPAWLATILRFWQNHPSMAYLFTGCYVGASSQAPRPDESARDLYDLEMGYRFLESLPPGDHRELINETLRHLQTDITGNSHRSETSFDKFWNPAWPAGALGLIEFRAIESFPHAEWMSSVALLWTCLAAHLLEAKGPRTLRNFAGKLHDEYLLPERLWTDLETIFAELEKSGISMNRRIFRAIWDWRFPTILEWKKAEVRLTIRRALESWPLLCETPIEGGTTSRFVDTSMQRLEFCANGAFGRYHIYVNGRPLELRRISQDSFLCGLRYRRSNLYPSMHPGIPTQLPLMLTLVDRQSGRGAAHFELGPNDRAFRRVTKPAGVKLSGRPCRGGRSADLTCDLRLE